MTRKSPAATHTTALPPEARDGLMRAWIAILEKRHPGTKWAPAPEPEKKK